MLCAKFCLDQIIGRTRARDIEVCSRHRHQDVRELTLREELVNISNASCRSQTPAVGQRIAIGEAKADECGQGVDRLPIIFEGESAGYKAIGSLCVQLSSFISIKYDLMIMTVADRQHLHA
jgi:hypothetical protein